MLLPLGLGIPLAIISVIGFLLNGYILLVLILAKQITPNNILLIHLSITQTLLSLIFLIFSFPPIVHGGIWISSIQFSCDINGFILTLLHPLSLWTICGLNCDRYYAIAAPLHYSAIVTNKKVFTGLISGWIVIFLLSIPPFCQVAPFTFSTNMVACIPNFATKNSLWYAVIFTFVTLIIPGIVIIGCNIKVLMIARYHRHRIAAAIYEVTLSAQVTITHQRNPFFVPTVTAPSAGGPKFRSRSPISTVLQLVGSFTILYLPYYISIMLDSITIQIYGFNNNVPDQINKANQYILLGAQCLLTTSTVINAILYGLKSKVIRKSFQNYWRKKRTKNEMNQEIQARTPSTCGSRRPSASNLGFLTRPLLQRRLSETLIDINRHNTNGSHHRNKMKRIASELTWRPISLTFAGLESPTLPSVMRPKNTVLAHTSSCNTLQVPTADTEMISDADRELYNTVRNSFRAAKLNENPRKSSQMFSNSNIDFIGSGGNDSNCDSLNSNSGSTIPLAINLPSGQKTNCSASTSVAFGTANFLLHKVLKLENHHINYHQYRNEQQHLKRLTNNNNTSSNNNYKSKLNNIYLHNKRSVFKNGSGAGGNITKMGSPLKSPRILITRAFSDESESKTPSIPGTPSKEKRPYASQSNLMDHHNYNLSEDRFLNLVTSDKCQTGGAATTTDFDSSECETKLNDNLTSGSNSTTVSELSHRRYSSLEETSYYSREFDIDSGAEEQMLLSWPTTRKKMKIYYTNVGNSSGIAGSFKNNHKRDFITGNTTANKIDVYRPSPLYNDRCEEPEVIL